MKGIYINFLKKYVFKQKKFFFFACLITVAQSGATMILPQIYRNIIDNAIPNRNMGMFGSFIIWMLTCYFVILILNVVKDYVLARIAEGLCFKLRTELHDKISALKYSYFDEHGVSDVLARYNREVDVIKDNCGYMLIKILSNSVTFLMAGAIIIIMEWKLLFLSLAIIIIYILNNRFWGKKVRSLVEASMKCNEEAIEGMTESYNNVLITKLYSAYQFVNQKFLGIYKNLFKTQMKLEVTYSISISSGGFLVYLLTGLVWLIGGLSVFGGSMTIGGVTALTNYNSMLLAPMNFFCEFNNSYQGTVIAIKRLMAILNHEEESGKGIDIKEKSINRIVFSDVSFQYSSSHMVLNDVNLELEKGEFIAFVGGSGSGKSTLVKLLLRLYHPSKGKIFIEEDEIRDIGLESLRSKISFIPQESCFYKGSIIENLKMGKEVDMDEVSFYSQKLDLYNEIEALTDKWDSELKSGTSNLSGGQKKRLDILRAILRKSDVIIFDESTASLDIERRRLFFEVLESMKEEKIFIFITHNLEECERFDKIFAIKEKKVLPIEKESLEWAYIAS